MLKIDPITIQLHQRLLAKIAQSGAKQADCAVPNVPGLRLCAYRNGRACWHFRQRVRDFQTGEITHRNHHLGDAGVVGFAEAVATVQRLKTEAALGVVFGHSRLNLSDYFDTVYRPAVEHKKRSLRTDVSRFNCHIRPVLGALRLADFGQIQLRTFTSGLSSALSTGTRNRVIALTKTIFRHAFEGGVLAFNPAETLRLAIEKTVVTRVLSPSELGRLLEVIENQPQNRCAQLVKLLLATGMRLSEALNARFQEVDFEKKTLRLMQTKNGRERDVPLSGVAMSALEQQLALSGADGFVFPGKHGKPMARPVRAFHQLLAEAEIEGLTFHDIRRSTCSILVNNGTPLLDASKLLGHGSVAVTARYYAMLDLSRLTKAANAVAAVINSTREGVANV